jgi:hypothetical protein
MAQPRTRTRYIRVHNGDSCDAGGRMASRCEIPDESMDGPERLAHVGRCGTLHRVISANLETLNEWAGSQRRWLRVCCRRCETGSRSIDGRPILACTRAHIQSAAPNLHHTNLERLRDVPGETFDLRVPDGIGLFSQLPYPYMVFSCRRRALQLRYDVGFAFRVLSTILVTMGHDS